MDRLKENEAEIKADDERLLRAKCTLAVQKIAQQLGPRYSPARANLDSFVCQHLGQKETIARVRELSARLAESIKNGENIVLYGTPGTGKDHLQASLLYATAGNLGLDCAWTTGLAFYAALRDGISRQKPESETLKPFMVAPVLAISDPIPPAADPSGWATNNLHSIIDYRYTRLLPVWVTVNVSKIDQIGAALSEPLLDRLRDGGNMVPCFWPSYRREKSKS